MDLTKYRNIFGEPKKGIHSVRVLGISLFDVVLTGLGAYLIGRWTGSNPYLVFVGLIFLGIGVHGFFGVNTQLNSWLGISKESYKLKNPLQS